MTRRRVNQAGGLTEAQWQGQVLGLARHYGWRIAHFHDSRREIVSRGQRRLVGDRAAAGFPDLVLVRGPELIFAELKGPKTRITAEQTEWLDALQTVAAGIRAEMVDGEEPAADPDRPVPGVDVYLWRAPDLDPVHERLARGRVRHGHLA